VPQPLREVLAGVFGLSASEIPADASNETIEGWDSLHHLELMMALELEYGVHIPSDLIPVLVSLQSIEAYLGEQSVQTSA